MDRKISPAAGKVLFLTGTFFFWMGLYVYMPILPIYTEFLSRSLTLVGLVGGSYGFTQFLFRFPIGIWSDRSGRSKPFVLSAFVLTFVSCIGLALSPNAWFLMLFRGLSGVAACMWVAFTVLYASYFPEEQTARAMSHTTFCLGFGQMISAIGGKIADAYGWLAPFYTGAGLAVLGMLFMLPITENVSRSRVPGSFRSLLAVAVRRRLLLVSVITALSQFAVFMSTQTFLPVYAVRIGASKSDLTVMIFIINMFQTLSMLMAGTIVVPRMGYKAAVGLAYTSVAFATFATPLIHNLQLLFLIQGLGSLGRGLAYPTLMGLAIQGVPQKEKSSAMGFFQAVYAVGMFLGPAVGGPIGETLGLNSTFICAGAVYLIGAVLGVSMLPKRGEI